MPESKHDMTTIVHPINLLVSDEYDRAAGIHGAVFASPHEGYGVIAEEVQEAGDALEIAESVMKQPCARDCPNRKAGCGATCPDWEKWETWKKQEYKRRLAEAEVATAVVEGRIRCGKYTPGN